MKWEEDLIRDIRTNTPNDDIDGGWCEELRANLINGDVEFTIANHFALHEAINKCKRKKYFLEIGVHRNNQSSSTYTLLRNMDNDGIYLGVDIEDKTFLNNPSKGIHTIQTNSSNYEEVINKLNSLGVQELDFIFIDGCHESREVLEDAILSWELLKVGGIMNFDDALWGDFQNKSSKRLCKEL